MVRRSCRPTEHPTSNDTGAFRQFRYTNYRYCRRRECSSSWYGGSDPHRPDPASFGDSLAQLERFIYDVQNRAGEDASKPWLLGYEQGAVLASTFALIAPDLVSGIIALGGGLPSFSSEALLEPMNGNLPVLLIGDSQEEEHSSNIKASAAQSEKLGNDVTVQFLQLSTGANSAAAQAAKTFLDGKR